MNLIVAKSLNNAICEIIYNSKKSLIRTSHVQIQTFVRLFIILIIAFIVKSIVNSIITTIDKTKYDDIKSIRLFEIFEIVFVFVVSRLKLIARRSFVSRFANFFHVYRICYDKFDLNNNLHSHLR